MKDFYSGIWYGAWNKQSTCCCCCCCNYLFGPRMGPAFLHHSIQGSWQCLPAAIPCGWGKYVPEVMNATENCSSPTLKKEEKHKVVSGNYQVSESKGVGKAHFCRLLL
ncbi:hypothetical protein ACA910_012239 [Epithemia clementina (nom. ined.)]